MYTLLCAKTDRDTAGLLTYYTYTAPSINRLFTEDYAQFAAASSFRVDVMEGIFIQAVPPETIKELRRRHPGRENFGNNGLRMILTRPRGVRKQGV